MLVLVFDFVELLVTLFCDIPMLPNDPVLGEPPPDIFLIISRTIGIPTLAKSGPKNPLNCVLHGFIPKKTLSAEDFSICLASVYCLCAVN